MKNKFITDRISNMPTSIFSTMSKLAFEHKAINLGQGFPDFDGPAWIMEEAFKAMKEGKNQYAPSPGIFSLRQAYANVQKNQYGIEWNPDNEITITHGATEALFSTIQAFVQKGDEVIMFEPFYDSHQADVLLAGGTPRYVTLKKPDFNFDFQELIDTINSKTKAIIINSPHNPTGKVYTYEELEFISKLAIENDLLVISDEVYEFLTFDNIKHIPIATFPGMRERTITISSTGKTFSMTGWKIGFALAIPELTEAIQKVHQWTTFAVNTPAQHAMAFALTKLDEYLPDFRKDYLKKRDFVYNQLIDSPFKPYKPSGSYFIMADIPEIFKDDIHAATELVTKFGIATIPPSVFYGKSDEGKTMLRLCFAKKDETLKAGISRLRNAVNK
jgi:aspartate/methionine/tyrosine aminotransferase